MNLQLESTLRTVKLSVEFEFDREFFHLLLAFFGFFKELGKVEFAWEHDIYLLLAKPSHLFAIFPQAMLFSALFGHKDSQTVLFTRVPPPTVLLEVTPSVDTKPMFLVVSVKAFVAAAVAPDVNSESVHHVLPPLPTVLPLICPYIHSVSIYLVFFPHSLVHGTICPVVDT